MKNLKATTHPEGGTISWVQVGDRLFSILDSDYPFADDVELQERDSERAAIPGTEQRFVTVDDARAHLATIEG